MASTTARKAVSAPKFKFRYNNIRQIIAIGRNYADHVAELGNQRPDKPFFFFKSKASLVLQRGPKPEGEEVIIPKLLIPKGVNVHYEVELALHIKDHVHHLAYQKAKLADEQAWEQLWKSFIGGYGIAVDMTARNIQEEAKAKGLPWSAAKGYNTFLPLSLRIPPEVIPDPHNVRLQLKKNGEVVQDDNTDLMLFKIPELLLAITDVIDLGPGDLILTGTPKGVGPVVAGDVLKASAFVGDKEIASFEIPAEDRVDEDGNPW